FEQDSQDHPQSHVAILSLYQSLIYAFPDRIAEINERLSASSDEQPPPQTGSWVGRRHSEDGLGPAEGPGPAVDPVTTCHLALAEGVAPAELSLDLSVRRPSSQPELPAAPDGIPEPRPDVVLRVALEESRLVLRLDAPKAGVRNERLDPLPLDRRDLAALRQI